MALYDGFFDAVQDETTEEYDRVYESGDFTGYFANVIGSGVCIHNNPDSFKAEYENGTLYLRPGYLFIQGYWLANRAEEGETDYKGYAVTLPTNMAGSMAVVAHLNMGQRMIEIEVRAVSQAYPDALVLAIITTSTAEDTRHNTDICGVIDTAGELSGKVEWALNYIDIEIGEKISQAEADIAAQSEKLDKAIASVNAQIDKITPQSIGTIKFSAAKNIGDDWLPCDGRFISDNEYPALAEVLRGTTHGIKNIYEVASWLVADDLCFGCFYGGYYWNVSEDKKLYRVSLNDGTVSEILISTDVDYSFSSTFTLSIIDMSGKTVLYLVSNNSGRYEATSEGKNICYPAVFYYYCDNFDVSLNSVSLTYKSVKFDRPIYTDIPYNYGTETYDHILKYGGFLGCEKNFLPKPVVVFDSVPYIAAGIFVYSEYPKGTISYPKFSNGLDGYCTIVRYIEWFSLEVNNEKFIPYLLDVTSVSGALNDNEISKLPTYLKDIRLINGAPFSQDSGGLYIPNSSNNEVGVIKGNTSQILGRGASFSDWFATNVKSKTNVPVFNKKHIIFFEIEAKEILSRFNITGMNLSTMKGFDNQLDREYRYLYDGYKVISYLEDFDIWAIRTDSGIIFIRDPDNESHYMFLDLSEIMVNEKRSLIKTFIEYDKDTKRLYFGWDSTNYYIHLYAIELPDDFDPINGTNLPVLSMSGVPGYIKAKEAES